MLITPKTVPKKVKKRKAKDSSTQNKKRASRKANKKNRSSGKATYLRPSYRKRQSFSKSFEQSEILQVFLTAKG